MKSLLPFVFALGTALCWGLYGPTLGKARTMEATPFKPYVGIGVAYLVIAIAGGLIAITVLGKDKWNFTDVATRWGFAAGVLGALGALSLTLAMFNGGHKIPHAVMPFVFGGAVTVTAVYSVINLNVRGNVWLWLGIAGMAICAVLVAYNTPHAAPKKHDPQEKPQVGAADVSEAAPSPAEQSN